MDLANTNPIKCMDSDALYGHATRKWQMLPNRHIRAALWASNRDWLYIVAGCIVFIIGMKGLMDEKRSDCCT